MIIGMNLCGVPPDSESVTSCRPVELTFYFMPWCLGPISAGSEQCFCVPLLSDGFRHYYKQSMCEAEQTFAGVSVRSVAAAVDSETTAIHP